MIRRAPALLPDVMDGKNVGMIERRNGPRFLLKAPQPLAVSGERLGQNFHRDIAPQPGVARSIQRSKSRHRKRRS
jgi:hypothetical protein